MSDLGDLSAFMKEGSVADLDWLDVDEAEYRKLDTLPKQNLDVQPDLEALWAREDRPPTNYLIPNKEHFPGTMPAHTMGDLSQAHGPLRSSAEEIRKVARLALMQSPDPTRLRDTLVKRFGIEPLRENRDVLASVLAERGLLGKLYVSASDFTCETGNTQASTFVRRFANDARYVLAKDACAGCRHASKGPTGATNCAVFHKEIKLQVPYTEALATTVENAQRAQGKDVQASNAPPRERIRLAMLAPDGSRAPAVSVYNGQGVGKAVAAIRPMTASSNEQLVQASDLLKKKRAADQGEFYAKPIVAFLRREMVKGLATEDLVKGLKLAFSVDDLKRTREHWEPIFKEAGLYGVVYSTQDTFADCHEGADFLAKHNPGVRAMVAGEKCGSCIYAKGRCMLYGKPLIKQAEDLYTPETVQAVMLEHRTAGRLPPWDTKTAASWGTTPREQLKAIHTAAKRPFEASVAPSMRMDIFKAFTGGQQVHSTSDLTKRAIVKKASRLMNEGLYGRELLSLLKAGFESRDLIAAKDDLRAAIQEQGLQGIYYINASAYDDYGRGCDEAARLHRARLVPYVKIGDKCGSCVHQRQAGFCSKINKPLVFEPPYMDKQAQQAAILATAEASTDNPYAGLVNNGLSMMAEYQLQNGELGVEVREASEPTNVAVEFTVNHKIKL